MFPRVLIPTDFSWYAQKTLQYAMEIPCIAEAVLLHIADETTGHTTWRSLDEVRNAPSSPAHALAYAGAILENAGISVIYEIAPAPEAGIHSAILASAERHGANLILIGGKGRGFLQDMLLGRVSQKVLFESKFHVLLTHFDEQSAGRGDTPPSAEGTGGSLFSRILVPVDFSRPAYEIVGFVSEMGGFRELVLLHVIAGVEDRTDLQTKLEHSMQRLSALQRDLDSGAERITPRIRFGDPAEEICNVAADEKATLILISRFGASDYTRNAKIGTVAAEVARQSRVPVLVRYPSLSLDVQAREIAGDELARAGEAWSHYRQQTPDRSRDRVFGVFVEQELVSLARCRRYGDGMELDGVFTREEFRGRGYAGKAVSLLVRECGTLPMFTYSTGEMVRFFESFGFASIPERDVPPSIRERYSFAAGELGNANLYPMRREASGGAEGA